MTYFKTAAAAASLVSLFLFNACTSVLGPEKLDLESDFQDITINDSFSVKLPDYMEKNEDLNADASLQYQNAIKETYMVVIDESKVTFQALLSFFSDVDSTLTPLENYANVQANSLKEGIVLTDSTDITEIKIDGKTAYQVELEGSVEGVPVPIYYMVTFLESESKLFMSMQWTLLSRKEKFRGTFLQTINTFRSLE